MSSLRHLYSLFLAYSIILLAHYKTQIQHWATNVDITDLHGLFHNLEFLLEAAWGLGSLRGL